MSAVDPHGEEAPIEVHKLAFFLTIAGEAVHFAVVPSTNKDAGPHDFVVNVAMDDGSVSERVEVDSSLLEGLREVGLGAWNQIMSERGAGDPE